MPVYRIPVTTTDPRAGKCVNVWHMRTAEDSPVGYAALQNGVDALRTFYGALATMFPTGNTVLADFAVDVESNKDRPLTWTAVTGSGGTTVAPPHLAVCVSWKTSTRARRARGRTFLGPLGGQTIEGDGTVLTGTLTQVKTAAAALISSSMTDNGWALGVWGLAEPAPAGYTGSTSGLPHQLRDFTGHAVQDKFAVMRSRRP